MAAQTPLSPPPPPPPPPSPPILPVGQLHAGVNPEKEDDEDPVPLMKQLGPCAKPYIALQDCLMDTNRSWTSCQTEVKLLKACHDQQRSSEGGRESALNQDR